MFLSVFVCLCMFCWHLSVSKLFCVPFACVSVVLVICGCFDCMSCHELSCMHVLMSVDAECVQCQSNIFQTLEQQPRQAAENQHHHFQPQTPRP